MLKKLLQAFTLIAFLSMTTALGLGGCALTPPRTEDEQAKLNAVPDRFEPPIEIRDLLISPARAG